MADPKQVLYPNVAEPIGLTSAVDRIRFESPDHLDLWLEDGTHVIVYAPVGGMINIQVRRS